MFGGAGVGSPPPRPPPRTQPLWQSSHAALASPLSSPSEDRASLSTELLVAPVSDDQMANGCVSWQLLSVSLHRVTSVGFGIAVSGGRDNPHFTSGDPAVVISDVVLNGPAWGLLQVNDRILSANGVSFENIEYSSAVDIIKNAEQLTMVIKRRVAVPVMEYEQRTLKFTLSKSRKKDDFGIVLGCKFYIKEIRNAKLAEKEPGLKEGDTVLRINGQSVDSVTLEEATKWLERSREKLCLVIQRDVRCGGSSSRWPSQQTVYERLGSVSATPRHSPSPMLVHQALSNRSSHEYINSPRYRIDDPLRTVSPGHLSQTSQDFQVRSRGEAGGIRTVRFRKLAGSLGIRVIGGNEVGIFVSAVQSESPAALNGICAGDRLVAVNDRSMRGVTREQAVQHLLALDNHVVIKVEHAPMDFENVRLNQLGDNFYIRSHFSKEKKTSPLELTINEGDIFHVTDTLFGGTVGLWQATRVYSANCANRNDNKGVIPNQSTAEQLAREMRRERESRAGGKGTLLRRKLESRRTKSLPKDLMTDPTELAAHVPLPAYERVALSTPSFHRPVVLLGALADIARQRLLTQFALRFAEPEGESIVRLAAVDAVIAAGKHCLLDLSLDSIERLQLAQYAPIVILIDVDGRNRIRELRKKANAAAMSTRKLMEQTTKIKKNYSHLLSATVDATHESAWFEALRELIAHLQQRRVWMPEFPPSIPLEDLLLFPLSSRFNSYDSDMDSLKGEYADLRKTPTDSLSRSIYAWNDGRTYSEGASQSSSSYHQTSEHSSVRSPPAHHLATLPRRFANPSPRPALVKTNGSVIRVSNPSAAASDNQLSTSTSALVADNTSPTRRPVPLTSPGLYSVQQVLSDDPYFRGGGQITSEMEQVRIRERDPTASQHATVYSEMRGLQGLQPLQPPQPQMYSPKNDRWNGYEQRRDNIEEVTQWNPVRTTPNTHMFADSIARRRYEERVQSDVSNVQIVNASLQKPAPMAQPETNSEKMEGSPSEPPQEKNKDTIERPSEDSKGEPVVLEQISAVIGREGGVLHCPVSKVELRIPEGAIAQGEKHEIYVKVMKDAESRMLKVCEEDGSSAVDRAKGETLLSPLVMCGPQGLQFLKPVELRLPHEQTLSEAGSVALKTGEGEQWKQVSVQPEHGSFLSVPIEHF